MLGPGFAERLHRDAHALALAAGAIKEDLQAAPAKIRADAAAGVAAARRIVASAPAAVERQLRSAPGAIAGAAESLVRRFMAPPEPAPKAVASAPRPSGPRRPAGPVARDVANAPHTGAEHGVAFLKRRDEASFASPTDVSQGNLQDCWLMAALAAIARADPASIEKLIHPLGDNLYEVTLHTGATGKAGLPTPEKMIVNDEFLTSENGKSRSAQSTLRSSTLGPELWVRLIEKAMAVKMGGYDGLVALDRGLTARLHSAMDLLQNQGKVQTFRLANLGEDEVLQHISGGFAHHRPMTSLSLYRVFSEKLKVHTFHHYAVKAVDVNARTVSLQNPWGSDDVNRMPIADYVVTYETLEIGPSLRPAVA